MQEKAIVIISVIQSISDVRYVHLQAPNGVCNDLDTVVHKFWQWSKRDSKRFLILKAWRDLFKPKKMGGLVFQSYEDFNVALLSKLRWKLINGKNNLRTQRVKAKYLGKYYYFDCKSKLTNSFV